jgi:hypothetical protein
MMPVALRSDGLHLLQVVEVAGRKHVVISIDDDCATAEPLGEVVKATLLGILFFTVAMIELFYVMLGLGVTIK